MKKIVVLLVVLLGCMPVTAFAQKQFFFKDGRFVVAQFTDLHWMPGSAKCAETAATIRAVLAAEHPDIAILSGDVVTDDPAMDGWKSVVDIFNEAKMLYLGEYVRDNWNKISNKAEYCLSVLLKEVEILPGMIGEEKEDE